MKLDHIGVVVRTIGEALPYYTEFFGMTVTVPPVVDSTQGVRVCFLRAGAEPTIELIEPMSDTSPVSKFLAATGGGLHHLAYEVTDLDAAVAECKRKKAMQLGPVYPGAGHHGRRAVWLFTPRKEIIELIEQPTPATGSGSAGG